MSRSSDEVHTWQLQPIIGTPNDVPEPKKVSLTTGKVLWLNYKIV
jgi:hypothetical protein